MMTGVQPRATGSSWVGLVSSAGLAFWMCVGFVASGAEVTLEWDPSPDPDIAGYRLYYGSPSGYYSNVLEVGTVTNRVVADLRVGATYSFYVTCYNAAGLESEPSNVVEYVVPAEPGGPAFSVIRSTASGTQLQWSAVAGSAYEVLAKDDLSDATWQTLETGLLAAGESMYWVDATSLTKPRRFYRIQVLP